MKIMVTGGCGFIGSNFIKYVFSKDKNAKILNIDKMTYAANTDNLRFTLDDSSLNYYFSKTDICDQNTLKSIIFEFSPDFIINFAAESHVDNSIKKQDDFMHTNILGTYNLLLNTNLFIKESGANLKFIHISTDEVFGSLKDFEEPFTEKSAYNPNSPYSASKASSDHLVRSWVKTFGFPAIITNCSNNYGPYQHPEKLIPRMIINCLTDQKLPVYGDGLNIRDWINVYDHCSAIYLILNRGSIGETYNIGGNSELKNIDIIDYICSNLDIICPSKYRSSYKDLITYVKDRPGHDYRYAINSTKISEELGWNPKIDFKNGLEETIRWYVDNKEWWEKTLKEL